MVLHTLVHFCVNDYSKKRQYLQIGIENVRFVDFVELVDDMDEDFDDVEWNLVVFYADYQPHELIQ